MYKKYYKIYINVLIFVIESYRIMKCLSRYCSALSCFKSKGFFTRLTNEPTDFFKVSQAMYLLEVPCFGSKVFFFHYLPQLLVFFIFSCTTHPCCYPTLDYYQSHLFTFHTLLDHIFVHNVNISEYCNKVNIFMRNGN
jgi:hypothetical protein